MTEKRFYRNGFEIKFSKGDKFKFTAFNVNEADKLVDILNDLLSYKLLVRKHKKDLEAIYGKPISKQLKEVIE